MLSQEARVCIARTTGPKWHDDAHRFCRIGLRRNEIGGENKYSDEKHLRQKSQRQAHPGPLNNLPPMACLDSFKLSGYMQAGHAGKASALLVQDVLKRRPHVPVPTNRTSASALFVPSLEWGGPPRSSLKTHPWWGSATMSRITKFQRAH